MNKHSDKESPGVGLGIIIALVLAGAVLTAKGVNADTDVPPPTAEKILVEEDVDTPWCGYTCLKEKALAKWNKEDTLEQQIKDLTAMNEEFLVKQRYHDAIVDDMKKQSDKTVDFMDSIIDEMQLDMDAVNSKNKLLNSSLQDLQDKDNSLLFVEGCWVPLTAGQHTAQ